MLVLNYWEFLVLNIALIAPVGILVVLLALLAEPLERLGNKLWQNRKNRKD